MRTRGYFKFRSLKRGEPCTFGSAGVTNPFGSDRSLLERAARVRRRAWYVKLQGGSLLARDNGRRKRWKSGNANGGCTFFVLLTRAG